MKKLTKADIINQRMLRVERAAADLMNSAEQWSVTGATFWDLHTRRRELLSAGRAYAKAVNALARPV